jgi:hypothetical protein
MSERNGTSLFTLVAGAALGYAGYALYRNAKQKLPADATPGEILREMNPIPTLVAAADKAKTTAREAASTASDTVRDAASKASDTVRDATQTAKDKFNIPGRT